MKLEEAISRVKPLDAQAMAVARKRWDSIAKPLHSLGKLETMVIQIAGMTGTSEIDISQRALIPMCADNGVVEEGVTQTGQEVTAIVADNFLKGITTACVMAKQCGVDVIPVDVGIAVDTQVRTDLKVAYGTKNMTKGPAMTREEAVRGIEAGIQIACELKEKGYNIFATALESERFIPTFMSNPLCLSAYSLIVSDKSLLHTKIMSVPDFMAFLTYRNG